MAKIAKVKLVLSDAVDVKAVWNAIPDFKMGGISLNDFIAVHDETDSLDKDYSTKDVELTGVKNKRDEKAQLLGELVTRFRSGPNAPLYIRMENRSERIQTPPAPRPRNII